MFVGFASADSATAGLYFLVLMLKLPSALILIDGSNFYHSLKESKSLPFDADKFELLFKQIDQKFEIKEIRYYDAIKDRTKDPIGYAKQQKFHSRLETCPHKPVFRSGPLRYLVNLTEYEVKSVGKKVGIIDKCNELLYKLLIELGLIRATKEKGIDVLLVVDSIELARTLKFDYVILLSGDADFVPAIKLIKTLKVKTLNLHMYSGSSTELRTSCDEHALIYVEEGGLPQIRWY